MRELPFGRRLRAADVLRATREGTAALRAKRRELGHALILANVPDGGSTPLADRGTGQSVCFQIIFTRNVRYGEFK